MSTIYCDEAGNSGEHLLDPVQPFFVLASNDFSSEEANALIELVQSRQGGEPKFTTLRKTRSGQRRLERLLRDARMSPARIVVDFYHKRFMVVTKLVDIVIETLAHMIGKDLYKGGMNIALCNMLYYCMPPFCGEQETDRFLWTFVDMIRERSPASIEVYFAAADALLASTVDEQMRSTLEAFADRNLFPVWFEGLPTNSLDPAIPALFSHISRWSERKPSERLQFLHDDSKPVLASLEMFENMMAAVDEPSSMVGYDRRKFPYPLRVDSIEQGDSKLHMQIQVADLCAGAINYFLKHRLSGQPDAICDMIEDAGCTGWIVDGIAPTPSVTPEELGTDANDGVNPIDPIVDRGPTPRRR